VFRDVGSLEPGVEWHTAIERVLGSSDACIVVIGPRWLSIADANGKRRLDDARDTVRKEVATALANGMRVFPVLVGGAKMPAEEDLPEELQSLARRHALEITEQDFDEDVIKLSRALERALGWTPKPEPGHKSRSAMAAAAVAATVVVVAVVAYLAMRNPAPVANPQTASGNDQPVKPPVNTILPPDDRNAGKQVVEREPPPPAPKRETQIVGTWRAVVISDGQQINESVDVYPDSSFRVMYDNNVAAVGRWRRDSAEGFDIVNAVNFLGSNTRFSCHYSASDDGLQGSCRDQRQNSWTVTLTNPRALQEVETELPAVDFSGATMAERAAFGHVLSSEACTCGCGLDMHTCLLKDRTCPLSPGLARTQWATFLRLVRA
jgi:hypothetical protein